MRTFTKSIIAATFILGCFLSLQAQESQKINPISSNAMPNRISMNVTIAKQTQGATFGEKVKSEKINVTVVDDGCVILFSSGEGYRVSGTNKTIVGLSPDEARTFGEKVNQGLHAAGSAVAQRTAIVGGALPGGAIISAAVSSVGNLAGAGGGAAAASYAKTQSKVYKIQDADADTAIELADGEYELSFIVLKGRLKTQVRIGFSVEKGILKTKHDTAKNSVGNIR
ncbi:hypothetical protein [Flavobacterium sangjuense]|uniref:Uncharacterized protein n=1 Tax=Flavobacterium sangjuense TaxID=2518177 RepID=A0A4P7PUT6_9FLAO|nr:hypothetical protein [Flavobacterium sangjuense]QBZ98110.1 hypothetical protein GS03_01615 [Flavobacterium sangjuense]